MLKLMLRKKYKMKWREISDALKKKLQNKFKKATKASQKFGKTPKKTVTFTHWRAIWRRVFMINVLKIFYNNQKNVQNMEEIGFNFGFKTFKVSRFCLKNKRECYNILVDVH